MCIDCDANTNISVTKSRCVQTVMPTLRRSKCQITHNNWQPARMNLYSNNTSVLSAAVAPNSCHLIVCVVPKHFSSAGRKDSLWRWEGKMGEPSVFRCNLHADNLGEVLSSRRGECWKVRLSAVCRVPAFRNNLQIMTLTYQTTRRLLPQDGAFRSHRCRPSKHRNIQFALCGKRAAPWFKRIPGFGIRPVRVGSVMDTVALWQVFSPSKGKR